MATKAKTIGGKVTDILGSVRFWILTLSAVLFILEDYAADSIVLLPDVLEVAQAWLLGVVGIGTIDSFASKFGKK